MELFFITDDAVMALPDAVPAVKGIIKVHQVHSKEPGKISVRSVNCDQCYTRINLPVNCFRYLMLTRSLATRNLPTSNPTASIGSRITIHLWSHCPT